MAQGQSGQTGQTGQSGQSNWSNDIRFDRTNRTLTVRGNSVPIREFFDTLGIRRDDVNQIWEQGGKDYNQDRQSSGGSTDRTSGGGSTDRNNDRNR